ncbi:hypothetical protein LCGC14_0429760 [marine sediment metagenome]|uniref:Uncharacterized protein n=1 Tax=marine sediment metagenome TaxID=412755 RepID=A0A0F9SNE1_9ZZZZ
MTEIPLGVPADLFELVTEITKIRRKWDALDFRFVTQIRAEVDSVITSYLTNKSIKSENKHE